jgi:cytochrome c peroxidase
MKKKSTSILLCLCFGIFLILYSCSKKPETPATNPPVTNPPTNPPTGNTASPALPATPYNYANTSSEIPVSIADLINKNPSPLNLPGSIDNTPSDNAITDNGATLGRVLFYDKRLSVNNTIACASCHHPDKAFTDGTVQSEGFEKNKTRRNSMSIVNLRYFRAKKMFWDMRAADLETQALMPIQDMIEMGMPSLSALEEKVKSTAYYPDLFQKAFGTTEVTSDKISKALAQFMRSIISFNSKYDKGLSNNFADFSQQERNGKLLVTRAFCTECHSDLASVGAKTDASFLIADNSGLNIGFGSNNGLDAVFTDNGIGEITKKTTDMGTFKIPTLRNIELTAPYMHDGRFATLEKVLDHYATGVKNSPNRGIQMSVGGFKFSEQEKKDIIAFLKTLTDPTLATNPKYANPFR